MRVEATAVKPVSTKRGMSDTFSFKCDDGQWYNTGFENPSVNKGDEVDFEFESTKYGNKVKIETIKIKGTSAGGASTVTTTPYRAKPVGSYTPREKVFPVPLTHGDRAIIRQNSVSNAVKVVEVTGFVGKDVNDTVDIIIKIARRLEAYSAGDLERMGVDADIETKTKAPK